MARRRDINDIDDDKEGLVDYSGDSDDDYKSKGILPEEAFRRRHSAVVLLRLGDRG